MKLLTKAILQQFEKVGDQPVESDPIVICKFFCAGFHRTWYATEYNPRTKVFFGFVDGDFPEWGTFSLTELEGFEGHLGLRMERDRHFSPCRFSELAR